MPCERKAEFDESTGVLTIHWGDGRLALLPGRLVMPSGEEISFREAGTIEVREVRTGADFGLDVRYGGFGMTRVAFTTAIRFSDEEDSVRCEWIPESEGECERVIWPIPEVSASGVSVLPLEQGELVPYNWPVEVRKLPFDGQFCTSSSTMPWIGRTEDGGSWQMIAETPWDGGWRIDHPAGGPTRELSFYWLKSLGEWRYRRIARLVLGAGGYNQMAKRYREMLRDRGELTTLKEKLEKNPTIARLIGAKIVHFGIKSHTAEDSSFYDPEHPEKNDALVSFAKRAEEIRMLQEAGAGKLYLHLDGWSEYGYDNHHPDVFPVCEVAGGISGLLDLARTVREGGGLIGLHDQYRDYYFAAETFDRSEAVTLADGSNPEHAHWAGGHQTYLCSARAPFYMRRNFKRLFDLGFYPDCSYLDVFTCNEPDECFHPRHRVTRKESLEHRTECFAWLNARGIVPSSEECAFWAIRELVFCHYGPHRFMLQAPGTERMGIPVPLFNLVFHDCMMIPWMMERGEGHEDYMLYALLNAGMPYLIREGAYPGIDGAFGGGEKAIHEKIERADVCARLQERLAFAELTEHRMDPENPSIQETLFSDGTKVIVDFGKGTYRIDAGESVATND